MLRRIIAAMYFWSRNPQYMLLPCIVMVFSTLSVDVNSQSIHGSVTITPKVTEPNRDVQLRCQFNLTIEQTTLLYWNDKRGDTLYFYEKGKNISLGPQYKTSVKNVITDGGDHRLTLRVTGCNNSPYKCDIWMDSTEHIIQESIEIKLIADPGVYSDSNRVLGDIEIPNNTTYKLACKVPEATMEHNLTMEVKINGNQTVSPAARVSSYNSTTCLYSCSLQKDYFLFTSDEVEVKCTARYKDGSIRRSTTTTPEPCAPNPCQNGGTCEETSRTDFRCECPDDWSGTICNMQTPHCFGGEINRDIPVVLGSVVTLECASHTLDHRYRWTDANNVRLLTGRTLRISEAFLANRSVYVCHASRAGCSQEQLTRIKLSVIYNWEVAKPREHVELEEGELVKLDCNPAKNPEPMVQWYRKVEEPIVSTDDPTIMQSEVPLGNPTMGSAKWTIERAAIEDSGIYICKAFSLDAVEDIRNVTLVVLRLGESKMLDMSIIIIIVVVAVILIIVIVTLAIVMCVKKKKGTVYSVRTTKVMSRYASLGR